MGHGHDSRGEPAFWHRPPTPHLTTLVSGIYGYRENGVAMRGLTEAASLAVPLIVNFGSPFRIGLGRAPTLAESYGSFAAGLFAGPIIMDSDGAAACIQINFTPLGGRLFFGLPMSELADRMVTVDDLADRGISQFARRLADLNSWEARLDLAEHFVGMRLGHASPANPAIHWAFCQLMRKGGDVRIGTLAEKLDWSRRRLVASFREEIGLAPKSVSRIIRFNAAQALAARGTAAGWADIAAACGYADQAHLTREFSLLAGCPPTAWRMDA
ncbi:helix-turn-helix domain-containing protein [Labrys sp. LIt4]|uniref:helix-turn-helix domain-containing protein n=1 Tax=Labrys sp. LIt4 TaxID=2821355 RepID=UPI001FD79A1D|nr:helix-turn-helix domain-containing protein [Labrys sp. LIt4]